VGSKLNIPLNMVDRNGGNLPFQSPGDNEYVYLYDRIIHPILESFDPEFILVSSGFDAARWDPVGGFSVTPNAFYYMTRRLTELKKPMLCVLEGGYNFRQTALATSAVVRALVGDEALPEPIPDLEYGDLREACHLEQAYH
jgi:histone deacetylase 6